MSTAAQIVIPNLNRLVARDQVLDGYVGQYALMAQHGLRPSEFEATVT